MTGSLILCLDLGSTTGFAVGRKGLRPTISGSMEFRNSRFDGGGMRLVRFRGWLFELYLSDPFQEVYYEEVRRHLGIDAAHLYGGFQGILTSWCEDTADPRKPVAIPYEGVPVGSIKRHATGNGSASKPAMMGAARNRGHEPADDNEADALALYYLRANVQVGAL